MRKACMCAVYAVLVVGVVSVSVASAQQSMPPPTGPVVFCGEQASPEADSYQLVFNGGEPEALTMDVTKDEACPTAATHSFSLPASLFTVGQHTVAVEATNAFGSTMGPVYTVTVGIAPGEFTVTAVIAPSGG